MEIQTEDLLDKLKHSSEKLDSQYKAIIDLCDQIEKTVGELYYDINELEKEVKWLKLKK